MFIGDLMRKIIVGVCSVCFVLGEGVAMEPQSISIENKRPATVAVVSDAQVKAIASQYIEELSINGPNMNTKTMNTKIISAINETSELNFWKTHGRLGQYRVYSKSIAEFVLSIIADKTSPLMRSLAIVVRGIISGQVSSTEEISYNLVVQAGVKKSLLSKIGIWQ